MQDSLIGYLLGALDDEETSRFEVELEGDIELQTRLSNAAHSLRMLKQDRDDIEPPGGLAQSTCAYVHQAASQACRSTGIERGAETDQWTLIDMVIAASVVLATCMLFFPAINNSRYHAQIAGCQNNLRSVGRALIEYSSHHAQGFFPQVPETGKFAVAGMYAPTLIAHGLITEDHRFFCPSSSDIEAKFPNRIPAIDEVENTRGQILAEMQCRMGGDYGYTLGVEKNGRLSGIRNQSRTHFAIMSDSPDSFVCEVRPRAGVHRNVLFESGNVRTVTTICWCGDQLYRNDHGEVSAGVHESDIVIGASGTAPIANAAYFK